MASLGTLVAHAELRTTGFQKGAKDASRMMRGVRTEATRGQAAMSGLMSSARMLLPALGVGTVLMSWRRLNAMTEKTRAAIDATAKSARALSIEIADLQAAQLSGRLMGIDDAQMSKGLERFKRAIADAKFGDQTAVDALARIGLTAQDVAGADTGKSLRVVADAFSKLNDEAAKTAATFDLFGRSGAKFKEWLEEGPEAIEKARRFMEEAGTALSWEEAYLVERRNDRKELAGETLRSWQQWWAVLESKSAEGWAELSLRTERAIFGAPYTNFAKAQQELGQYDPAGAKAVAQAAQAKADAEARAAEAVEKQNALYKSQIDFIGKFEMRATRSKVDGWDKYHDATLSSIKGLYGQQWFRDMSKSDRDGWIRSIKDAYAQDRAAALAQKGADAISSLDKRISQFGLSAEEKAFDDATRDGIGNKDAFEIAKRTRALRHLEERQTLMDRIDNATPADPQNATALIQGTLAGYNASIRPQTQALETLVDLQQKANELTEQANRLLGQNLPKPYDITTGGAN